MKSMSSMILLLVRLLFSRNEFSVVFRQVRVWYRKSAGGRELGWSAEQERARFLIVLRVQGGFKFSGCRQKISTRPAVCCRNMAALEIGSAGQ